MNFLSMKYFLTLAEEKNFTRAAERLHITQQTLSAHIGGLEKEVGTKLFVRHVPLELTDSGAVFLRYARIFFRNELALKRELSDVSGQYKGTLRIGIAPCRGRVELPKVIASFRDAYPHVRIGLHEMANGDIWNALKHDEIDVAMARLEGELPGIAHRPWMEEEIVLLVSKDLAKDLWGEEAGRIFMPEGQRKRGLSLHFADCPFLLNSEEDIAGALARTLFRDAGFSPWIAVDSENMETLLDLCLMGKGAYFCPKNLVKALLTPENRKKLYVLEFQDGKYGLSFGFLKNSHRWKIIEKWMDAVLQARE